VNRWPLTGNLTVGGVRGVVGQMKGLAYIDPLMQVYAFEFTDHWLLPCAIACF
jgi:hypothetical protein